MLADQQELTYNRDGRTKERPNRNPFNLYMYYFLHNIRKNNNTTNTNRINVYYRNQMHYNYKLHEQAIINII